MTVVSFPEAVKQVHDEAKKKLDAWPWDTDLGKPYADINGPLSRIDNMLEAARLANPPEEEVDDLARHKDTINPTHYQHKGVECIELTENMNFNLGNVVKYCYRCDLKGGVEDLKKALWYLNREIARRAR